MLNKKSFEDAFGIPYNKMSKDSLAQIVINQSRNNQKLAQENYRIAVIGTTILRQRDWFHKLCRRKNKVIEEVIDTYDDFDTDLAMLIKLGGLINDSNRYDRRKNGKDD